MSRRIRRCPPQEVKEATEMRIIRKTGMAVFATGLSLGLLTGCGAVSEIRDAIPNIDVNENGGSVTLKDDDGGSVTIDSGPSTELPAWLPHELPLPTDFTVLTSSELESDGKIQRMVTVTSTQSFEDFMASAEATLADLGITAEQQLSETGGIDGGLYNFSFDDSEWFLNFASMDEELNVSYMTAEEE